MSPLEMLPPASGPGLGHATTGQVVAGVLLLAAMVHLVVALPRREGEPAARHVLRINLALMLATLAAVGTAIVWLHLG